MIRQINKNDNEFKYLVIKKKKEIKKTTKLKTKTVKLRINYLC